MEEIKKDAIQSAIEEGTAVFMPEKGLHTGATVTIRNDERKWTVRFIDHKKSEAIVRPQFAKKDTETVRVRLDDIIVVNNPKWNQRFDVPKDVDGQAIAPGDMVTPVDHNGIEMITENMEDVIVKVSGYKDAGVIDSKDGEFEASQVRISKKNIF